jgi:tRNA(adenine34) deaminase
MHSGNIDEKIMRLALKEAQKAAIKNEVPVGAVLTGPDGKVLARGHNRKESNNDPTAHAEIVVIRKAAKKLGGWRLSGCTLHVTLEPCPMCAGAMVNARIKRLVFGCRDPKAGACGTLLDLSSNIRLNHRFETTAGVLETDCAGILKKFFRKRRSSGPTRPPATPAVRGP